MANEYASPFEVEARSPAAGANPGAVDDVLTAVSRWIDRYCRRKFWLDPTPTVRRFRACDLYELRLDGHEIGDSAGVIVATDDGTGAFATVLSAATYQLEPVNAPFDTSGPAPYTSIRLLSGSWPYALTRAQRLERVKVTARYGWPVVPPSVKDACITLTVDHFENPSGVRSEMIDGYSVTYGAASAARTMLAQYRRVLVA